MNCCSFERTWSNYANSRPLASWCSNLLHIHPAPSHLLTRHGSTLALNSPTKRSFHYSARAGAGYAAGGGSRGTRAGEPGEGWGRDWSGTHNGFHWRTHEKKEYCHGHLNGEHSDKMAKFSLLWYHLQNRSTLPGCPRCPANLASTQSSNSPPSPRRTAHPRERSSLYLPPPLAPPPPSRKSYSTYAATTLFHRLPGLHGQFNIFLILPISFLKSNAALNLISLMTRVALTLLPISLRARVMLIIQNRFEVDPSSVPKWLHMDAQHAAKWLWGLRFNAKVIFPLLVSLPFLLFGASVITSLETTPISGRKRLILISPNEEESLVNSILGVEPNSRDWISILRGILSLEDEGVSSRTGRRLFLGGEVLDARDWRFCWSKDVLLALEAGISKLAFADKVVEGDGGIDFPRPPLSLWPLAPRGSETSKQTGDLVADYELILVERPESNAFSFGFGPEVKSRTAGKRGVIVLYTGFIDEILGTNFGPLPLSSSSTFAGVFRRLFSLPQLHGLESSNKLAQNLPTPDHSKSLAVVLAHELSHLILSHTVESSANSSLLLPHISKLLGDTFRTLIYFVTFPLGPFFNDAIGRSIEVGARDGLQCFGAVSNSCESRVMEEEADVVSLRILANAGINARHALEFWERRLQRPQPSVSSEPHAQGSDMLSNANSKSSTARIGPPAFDSGTGTGTGDAKLCGFLRTHPVNEDRLERIRGELERWEREA